MHLPAMFDNPIAHRRNLTGNPFSNYQIKLEMLKIAFVPSVD